MKANSTSRIVVESGGTGVVAHLGLHALGSFADRLELGDALSSRIPWAGGGFPIHDRGKVLVQSTLMLATLMLAGGGESCLDIEHLRIGEDLFGSVPSDTTVFRTFHEITPSTREGIAKAMAEQRREVWRRSSATTGTDPVRPRSILTSIIDPTGAIPARSGRIHGRADRSMRFNAERASSKWLRE
ncbi:MAG: hypothetical protein ACRD0I_10975 [Acidimicrobiales bacterium]